MEVVKILTKYFPSLAGALMETVKLSVLSLVFALILGVFFGLFRISKNKFLRGTATKYFPSLAGALMETVKLSVLSLVFALILGVFFGLFRISKNKFLRGTATAYVEIIRGTPLMVQAFIIYYGIAQVLKPTGFSWAEIGGAFTAGTVTLSLNAGAFMAEIIRGGIEAVDIGQMEAARSGFSWAEIGGAFTAGTVTLSLNAGAFMAEIIRGGIEAVDIGQMEAARSLGLSYTQSLRKVILPQAFRIMLPSIINQCITSLKDTSILSVIGIRELTMSGKILALRKVILPQAFRIMLPSIINQCITSLKDTSILSVIGIRELTMSGKILAGNSTSLVMAIWIVIAMFYFVVCFALSLGAKYLEVRLKYGK